MAFDAAAFIAHQLAQGVRPRMLVRADPAMLASLAAQLQAQGAAPEMYIDVSAADVPSTALSLANLTVTASADTSVGNIPYGSTAAKTQIYSARGGGVSQLLGTTAITRTTPGSGAFGPANADYTLLVGVQKDNWQTSTIEGELNAAIIVARQGKKGDVSGGLIDVAKRRDTLTSVAADETGGALGLEGVSALINSSGSVYHELHWAPGFAEGPGGVSGGRGYGMWVRATKGQWFSGYHSAQLSPASFIYHNSGSNQADVLNYYVDAATGKVNGSGGFQIGTGSTLTFYVAHLGSGTIPSAMASLSAAVLDTITVPGAIVGDMVTVSCPGLADGFRGFLLSGLVTAADTVKIWVQNLNSTAAGGFAISYNAKVERFA